jgi:cytoskeletal protein CcmA (bactofilin family)
MLGIGNKNTGAESGSINLIGVGTQITGDMTSAGDVRIDGILNGDIKLNGRLVVGAHGKIEGSVICQNADISGEIKGTVQVAEILALKATAKISGDIITSKLAIEPGALFTGSCNMGAIVKSIQTAGEKQLGTKTA